MSRAGAGLRPRTLHSLCVWFQKVRTQQSARAFLQGLCSQTPHGLWQNSSSWPGSSNRDCSWPIHVQPKHSDPVLRFFDMCPAYDAYVKDVNHQFLVWRYMPANGMLSCLNSGLTFDAVPAAWPCLLMHAEAASKTCGMLRGWRCCT